MLWLYFPPLFIPICMQGEIFYPLGLCQVCLLLSKIVVTYFTESAVNEQVVFTLGRVNKCRTCFSVLVHVY